MNKDNLTFPVGDSAICKINPNDPCDKNSEYPFLPMDSVRNDYCGIAYFEKRKIDGSGLVSFMENDTIVAKITPCAENGKVAFIEALPNNSDLGFGSTEFIVFRPNLKNVYPKYLYYVLSSHQVHGLAVSLMEGTTGRQRIPPKAYKKRISAYFPLLPEQKAIAGILSKVDEAIEVVENSIMAFEWLKKSLMQNLLTGKLKPDGTWRSEDEFYVDEKFGKVPKGWDIRKGKELFRAYGSTTLDKVNTRNSGDCIYMKVSDFNLEGNEFYIDTANITFSYEENSNLTYCLPDFLVISKRGEAIRKNRVRLLKKRTLLDPNLMAFEIIEGNSLFYKFLLEEMNLQRFLENSTLPQLNNKDFYPCRFLYPPVDVQKEIGELLFNLYLEIDNKKSKIQSLKTLKKSLMQNLLTGKVRVNVEKFNTF